MTTKGYLLKEGFENLKKHGSKTFSTMLIICATMFVLGIFIILFQNVNKNVETVRVEQGLNAFIDDTATEDEIDYMRDEILQIPGVKNVVYLDKDKAYDDAKEEFAGMGMEYLLSGLETVKIFPASFVVTFDKIEQSEEVKAAVEKIDGIYKVRYDKESIQAVVALSKVVNIFLLGIAAVLLVISIFIISNTIKLAVYSNKREIFIMRYIGATNSFIRTPFVIEGAIMGVVSAIVSFITISLIYVVMYARLPQIGSSLGVFGFMPYSSLWYIILIAYLGLGLFIGVFGSMISIKKYMKV